MSISHKKYKEERARKQQQQNNTPSMNPQASLNPGCSIMVNNIGEERLLLSHLHSNMRVLEFGSGLSTNVIAKIVRQVVSVEYDSKYYNDFKPFANPNATMLMVPANRPEGPGQDGSFEEYQNYVLAPMAYAQTEKFDAVFIDGRARSACAEYSAKHYLKEGGIIFIHDYKHPDSRYRRPEYEVVESYLKLEKHVFAMAMFTVKGQVSNYTVSNIPEVNNIGVIPAAGASVNSPVIVGAIQQSISDKVEILSPPANMYDKPTPARENSGDHSQGPEIDKTTCWYSGDLVVQKMNEFFDKHIKNHEITKHMEPFTTLLKIIDHELHSVLLDLGCGSAMLTEFCKDFVYVGADLPEILTGCAMRNYPHYPYCACNIEQDDLDWIGRYPIIVINGIIDVMQHPLEMLHKILTSASNYVLIHRQEITEAGVTRVMKKGSYGGETWHSIISRKDFDETVAGSGFGIVAETPCFFGDWENGGRSFLLQRQ